MKQSSLNKLKALQAAKAAYQQSKKTDGTLLKGLYAQVYREADREFKNSLKSDGR